MSNFINCPRMSHEEWLMWRRNGIGSSDAPVIMNDRHMGDNLLNKWEEKVLGKVKPDNIFMMHGRANEEPARQSFEAKMGLSVFPGNVESSDTSWLRASLDGIDVEGKTLVEIKCAGKKDHSVALSKKIPEKYIAQCQHQLAVTGLPGMYYYSYHDFKGVIVEVARDEKYIKELLTKEQAFWDLVLAKEPPEIYQDMQSNQTWKKLAARLLKLRSYDEEKEKIVEELKELANGCGARGHGIEMQRQKVKGAVDYSKIPELKGVDLELYRKNFFYKYPIRAIN